MLIRMGMGGQLSGSVGGVVASRNRYGAYLRNRTVPVNPNTVRQQDVRASFTAAALAWKGLSDSQRGGWQSYATATPVLNRLGESITLSANAMFVKTNAFRLDAGAAILATAPPTPGLSTLGDISGVLVTGGTDSMELTFTGATALGPYIVQYSPSISAGVSSFGGPFSLFARGVSIAPPTIIVSAVPGSLRYGTWLEDERRYVRVAGSDAQGRLSSPLIFPVSAVA